MINHYHKDFKIFLLQKTTHHWKVLGDVSDAIRSGGIWTSPDKMSVGASPDNTEPPCQMDLTERGRGLHRPGEEEVWPPVSRPDGSPPRDQPGLECAEDREAGQPVC